MRNAAFVTLFPSARNIELTKDVGMIPYFLYKNHNYRSKIVCYNNGLYPDAKKAINGVPLDFLKKRLNSSCLDGAIYLLRYSHEIDILNLYHIGMKRLLLWTGIYHLCNPKGGVYLKLDMDYSGIEKLEREPTWKKSIRKRIFKKINLISAESKELCHRFSSLYNLKTEYIPNGFYKWHYTDLTPKEHTILTVGRLGTKQKATDLLLQAYARTAPYHDYRLRLVGKIQEDFKAYINNYYKKYPFLINRVSFVGEIRDKTALQTEYEKASIFVLPSRWESFGIVLAEACGAGEYLIVSDQVPSRNDFISNNQFGSVCKVNSVDDLADKLMEGIDMVNKKPEIQNEIRKNAEQQFQWNSIVYRLSALLEDLCV